MNASVRPSTSRIIVWSTRSVLVAGLVIAAALSSAGGAGHRADGPAAPASLRAAVEAARYAVHAPEGGAASFVASNPAQRYQAEFSPQGLTVAPKRTVGGGESWRVGLALSAVARGQARAAVGAGRVAGAGTRVTVAHTADGVSVDEWYVNKRTGLEHGITLGSRPLAAGQGPLRLQLALSGTLAASVNDAADAVRLSDAAGRAALTYDQLHVTDHDGRALASHFEVSGDVVAIVIADADAAYPVVVDPTITQQALLTPSVAETQDHFGGSIAISGDTAVVGTIDEDSNATGINGDATNNAAVQAGAAYVFVRDAGGNWTQQAYLKASNTDAGDQFGCAVAISGDTIVVGAEAEDSNAVGVNGVQTNNSFVQAGAAYVYVRSGGVWTQQAYLKASNTNARDHFGASVGISGDTIVVGATADDSAATTINGNQLDNSANGAGSAYVFVRSGTAWTQQAYLKPSNAEGGPGVYGDVFGVSVGISGNSIIVGAAGLFPGGGEDSAATGVNGNQFDNSSVDSGAAYVFVRSGTTWTQQAYLKASNTGDDDRFGVSVAIDQNTAVVGAMNEDSSAVGVGGNQTNDAAANSGAAYVFTRSGSTWSQQAYLKASHAVVGQLFGQSVSVSGDIVAVGAGSTLGGASVFQRTGTTWSADPDPSGAAGVATVAVSGDTIAVGLQNQSGAAGTARIYRVVPNQAPVAAAGSDQFATATSASGASVTLNGSASSDPDGDALTYEWKNDASVVIGTSASLSTVVDFGAHVFTLKVTDSGGLSSTDTVLVTVADSISITITTPPLVSPNYYRNQVVAAEFTCSDTANIIATCSSNVATLDTATAGAKTFTVTATNTRGDSASQSRPYQVLAQSAQAITFPAPAATTYGGSVTLAATATSGLAVSYTSNTPAVCSVTGSIATTAAAGTCSITAAQAGDANWLVAAPVTQTFTILTRPVTATLTANSKVYDGTTAEPNAGLSCDLAGVLAADQPNVNCAATNGAFDNPNAGSPRTVTATLTLSGSAAGNYTFGAAGSATSSTTAVNAATSTTASVVYGQQGDFTTTLANSGGLGAASLSSPRGVAADANGNIYVADRDNNRVLFYPFGQTTATRVYGQGGSFTTNAPGLSAGSFTTVNRVTVDATGLYVSDAGNNRVLFFPNNSTIATRVYGQGGSFTSNDLNVSGTTADSLGSTRAIAVDPAGNVYIADAGNNRVLFYPAGSTTATRVYGQNGSFTTGLVNNTGGVGGIISADSLNQPNGLRLDTAGNLYVADQSNHRVLMYPAGQTTATVVYGQGGSFTTGTANNGGVSASSFNTPSNLALDGGNNLYVADSNNNRVLFFPAGQTTATAVFGQGGSFSANTANNGGAGANSLRAPNSVDLDFAGNIYISDATNNRVLRYTGSAPAITPAGLTITASSGTKTYGGSFTVTPSYAGFVNGETASVLSSPATCTSAGAAANAAAGSYATTCSGAVAANYSIGYVAGTLTVGTAPLTATLTAAGKTYDGTTTESNASMSCSLAGVLPADAGNVTCTATAGTFDGATVGSHTVTATVTIGGSAAGNYTLGGAGTAIVSTSASASATIDAAGTTTTVTSSAQPAAFGQAVTLTATVTVVSPGAGTPTGAVTFNDGVTVLGTGTLDASGQATFTSSALTVGVHPITAVYGSDTNFSASTSPSVNQTVQRASTTTAVTSATNPSVFGQSVAFTATVSAVAPGAGIYGGAVTFKDGATTVCNSVPTSAGSATCTISSLSAGTHSITAAANGSGNFTTSTSGVLTQTVDKAASTTTVTCSASETFTGSALTPCTVTVTGAGGLSLTPAPTYVNNINAGTATASYTFDGDDNHNGSTASATFAITKATSTTTLTCPASVTYTGAAQEACTATATGVGSLSESVAVTYTNNTNVGTATADATFAGDANHDGSTGSASFSITKATSTTAVSCTPSVTYTGDAREVCTATATGAGSLSESVNVTYTNNTNVGTASADATFAGDANHDGSTGTATFAITKATSTTTVTCTPSVTYTGAAQEVCTATATGVGSLSESVAVTYTNNINVGTATADATFAGDANHDGSTGSANFSITKASSTTAVTCTPSVTYTGAAQDVCTATATGVGSLSESVNVTYTNNTNVGTATADATFAGDANHDGSTGSATFAITKASSTTTVTCTPSVTYTGAAQEVCTATATGVGSLSESVAVTYTNNTNVGTATADATFAGDANHDGSTGSATFAITKASSTTAVTCTPSVTYTGAAQEVCTATATGVGSLSQSVPVTYTNNTNVGTATADATFAGDANHDGSTGSANFSITKATSTTAVTCTPSVIYTGAAQEVCTATATGVGSLSQSVAVTYTNNTNVGTATADATFAGDANHAGSTGSATFAITKATSTTTVTCTPSVTYTGAAQEVCTATATGVGSLSESVNVTYTNNTNVGTATADATFAGDANHDGSTGSATFAITKASSTTAVTCAPSVIYTGAAQEVCTATATGVGSLSESVAVTYTNNTNVGTATANATFAGDANHDGSTGSASFAITKATSTTAVTCTPTVTYTGAAQEVCTATATGVGSLSESVNVTYTNNTNVGTATADATFAGDANHDGSTGSATFAITKAASTTAVTCTPTVTYTGAAQEVCTATATGVGSLSESVAVAYANNTNVGTATADATFAGDANHDGSTGSATFAITKASSTTAVTCTPSVTYTGAAQEVCTATATGVGSLSEPVAVTYTNNTNVGTATADATFAGDANHDGSTGSANFSITKASSTTVVTCTPSVTYTGAAQEVCTATATGVGSLSEPVAVTYTNNTNVGTATADATFAGDANHDGSTGTATFAITKASSTTAVTCTPSVTYTGAAQEVCTATATGVGSLSESVNVTYTNNTNVGTATADATFAGDANHDGSTGSANFAITKASSTTAVTCTPTVTYTGAAQEVCTATATGVGSLSQSVAVTYSNNTNVGTATADATFAGDANHDGSTGSATFAITKATSTTTVTCTPSVTYTGAAQEVCTATATGVGSLSESVNVTYTNNTNVGTATADATFAGDANHDGSTGSATFAITKASSTTAVTCTPSVTYTGAAQEVCTATATGVGSLSESVNVTYTNNTNVGTATADATFAGDANHDGSTGTATFAITKATSTTAVTCTPTVTYTGAAQEVCTATATGVGSLSESVNVTYTNNTNVGTATADATFAGDANHDGSTGSASFAITKAASTTAVTCTPSVTYTGAVQEVCTAVATGAGSLSESVNVTYTNNTNVGTATADATFAGDANHDGSTGSATFTITKASSTTTVTCTPSVTYTGAAQEVCTATATGVGSLSESVAVTYTNNTNVGTATADATFAGDTNHDGSTGSATFAITKATSTTTVTCTPSVTYTGAAQEVCTATATGVGSLSESVNVTYTNNTNVGTATADATFAGDANHDGSTGSANFSITKASSTTVVTCTPSVTYTGAAQEVCTATATGVGSLSESVNVTYTNNTNVGTATADATFAGDANHDGSTGTATFAITKATSTTAVTCTPTVTYTGAAQEVCTATATGVGSLSESVNVTYTNNTNVGTATADATFAGDANHDGSTGSASFSITKATSTTAVTCTPSVTYTGAAQEVCTATATGVGSLSESVNVTYTHNTNVGTATADATFAGDANHAGSAGAATFAITKAALVVTANDKTRAALAPNPAFDGTLTGVLGTDGITATYSGPATTVPGTYPIVPTLLDPNGRLGNYDVTPVNGTLTVVDADPPAVLVPASLTAEATSASGATVIFADQVSAVDAVFGPVAVTCAPASGTTFAIGETTVHCSAVDGVGNVGGASFVVTVADTVAPALSAADVTVVASNPAGVTVTYAPVGHDAVTGDVASVCSPTSGTVFTIGDHTVNCTATDDAGNVSATASFVVHVLDGVAPVVTVPATMTAEATGTSGATVTFAASASDNLDETLTTSCAPASGSIFPIGDTTVTCTAADAASNIGTATFVVTVRDTTAPTLALPVVEPVVSLTPTVVVNYTAGATDIVDGAVAIACAPASGSAFPVGSTQVQCSATDAHGNTATGSFTVKVNDGVSPVITVNPAGDRTIEATSSAGAVVTYAATATDNFDGTRPVTCSPASGSVFPLGPSTLVTCQAVDLDGNVGTATFTVTVVDTTAPVLALPAPITQTTTTSAGAAVSYTVSAVDTVSGGVPVTCAPASGSTFPVGSTTVNCTATDARGNSATGSFAVTVQLLANGIEKFVAFSRDETWLRANATVMTGDVGANERRYHPHAHNSDDGDRDDVTVRIGQGAEMKQAGSRVVGDTVLTLAKSSVYDVLRNYFIPSNRGEVRGSVTGPMAVPYLTLPSFPTVATGTTNIDVAKKKTLTLAPGKYNTVHVGNGATLILTGGLYQMLSLDVDQQGTVVFRAATEIRIKTELDTAAKSKLILDQSVPGLRASQMVIYVAGDDSVCRHNDADDDGDNAGGTSAHIGQNSVVQANIYAVKGTIWLKSKTQATGAFIGVHVRIGQNVTLTLDSAFR